MKFEKGEFVIIEFWDHCISSAYEIVKCKVAGWVIDQDDKRVTISYWIIDSVDKELVDNNYEPVNIIKSTILQVINLE